MRLTLVRRIAAVMLCVALGAMLPSHHHAAGPRAGADEARSLAHGHAHGADDHADAAQDHDASPGKGDPHPARSHQHDCVICHLASNLGVTTTGPPQVVGDSAVARAAVEPPAIVAPAAPAFTFHGRAPPAAA